MKKVLTVLVALCLVLFVFTACTDKPPVTGNPNLPEITDSTVPTNPTENDNYEETITKMFVTVNGNKLEVTLAKNSSVDALVEILKKNDIIYIANDYGDFEKVGDIGYSLPQNNAQITTQAGDVILYQGRNICLYYGANSWNFTRIGKINGYSEAELRALLGAGKGLIKITISLR